MPAAKTSLASPQRQQGPSLLALRAGRCWRRNRI